MIIGSGASGSVFRCLHILDEKDYAVKRIALKDKKNLTGIWGSANNVIFGA